MWEWDLTGGYYVKGVISLMLRFLFVLMNVGMLAHRSSISIRG